MNFPNDLNAYFVIYWAPLRSGTMNAEGRKPAIPIQPNWSRAFADFY